MTILTRSSMVYPSPLRKIKTTNLKKSKTNFISTKKGLYQISCKEDFRFYIGESENVVARLNAHKNLLKRGIHSNQEMQKACTKYGIDSFKFERLQFGANFDLDDRRTLETLILSTLEPTNRYNTYTNWRKRSGVFNPFYGKAHTLENRKLLSEAMSNKPSPFLNKKQSNEVKSLISKHKCNGGNRKKAIYIDDCFYESILEAHHETGLSRVIIRKRCNSAEPRYKNYCYSSDYKANS